MPDVQVYFAVKANSNPEIVKTLFEMGCSFDVASMPEFMIVYENIKDMPERSGRTGYGTRSSMPIPSNRSRHWRPWTSINLWSPLTITRGS